MIGISQFPMLAMKNRRVVEQSTTAGCFRCLHVFKTTDIKNYTDKGETVLCPNCNTDAIVDNTSEELLKTANKYWYGKVFIPDPPAADGNTA